MTSLIRAIRDKAPVAYAPRSGSRLSLFGSPNNAEGYLAQYGSVSTLFAIVSGSANAVSRIPWFLYNKRQRGSATANKGDRNPVQSHLAIDVLAQPNPFMTQQSLFETCQQHMDLVGESYWYLVTDERMPGVPIEIWPIRPDKMKPITHPTEFLVGWWFCGPDGDEIPLPRDSIIQFKMPNPLDPYRGMGPVQSLLNVLDSTRYSDLFNRNFFTNSAEPGGFIQTTDSLDDDEFDKLQMRWSEQHRGVSNAHRVAILESGMTFTPNQFSMRDMQFTQLRDISREIIREAFGFPKPLLGTVDDVNRASAEAMEYNFGKHFVGPRLERFKQKINTEFLPKFGSTTKNLEFDYLNDIPEDTESDNASRTSRVDAFTKLVSAGVDPDSAAEVAGLPPMEMVSEPEPQPEPVAPEQEVEENAA